MNTTRCPWMLAVLSCLTTIGSAQSLSVAASQPVTLTAQFGAVVQSSTLPAGPMPDLGSLAASAASSFGGGTSVLLGWHAYSIATEMSFEVGAYCDATVLTGQSTAPTSDFVVALSAPFPMAARIVLEKEIAGVSGAMVPVTRIDVGNDGSEELTEALVGTPWPVPVTLGPTPLQVRCTVGAQLKGPGSLLGRVRMRVLPRDTIVSPWMAACGPDLLRAEPRLDGGLQCMYSPVMTDPGVLVFGLAAQPLSLGTVLGLPCLLLPRPDFVTLAVPWTPFVLPIPPAVRPVQLFAQSVTVGMQGLSVGTGYGVFAY